MRLVNMRTGAAIADAVEMATTRRQRRRGLLGRRGLDAGAALVLKPCGAIHTAFMQFAIDVIFLDCHGRALRIERGLQPWRMAMSWRGRTVVELAAGHLDAADLQAGDRLCVVA